MILYTIIYFLGLLATGLLLGITGEDENDCFWFVVLWPLTLSIIFICLPFLLLKILVYGCIFIGSKIRKRK